MGAFEPLICPNCGADIDVPEGATVMRCTYCSSKLQLKDSGSVRALVLMGEKLDQVAAHAARAADGLERLNERIESAHSKWQRRMNELNAAHTAVLSHHADCVSALQHCQRVGGACWLLVVIFFGAAIAFVVLDIEPLALLGLAIAVLAFVIGMRKRNTSVALSSELNELAIDAEALREQVVSWRGHEPG